MWERTFLLTPRAGWERVGIPRPALEGRVVLERSLGDIFVMVETWGRVHEGKGLFKFYLLMMVIGHTDRTCHTPKFGVCPTLIFGRV